MWEDPASLQSPVWGEKKGRLNSWLKMKENSPLHGWNELLVLWSQV